MDGESRALIVVVTAVVVVFLFVVFGFLGLFAFVGVSMGVIVGVAFNAPIGMRSAGCCDWG